MITQKTHIQVVYLSFATRSLRANCEHEIQSILEKARKHNAEKDITGQLVYRSGMFLQLIEGDKSEIEPLLGRILLDSGSHENIKILLNQTIEERIFPDWSMAYKNLDNPALDIVNSIVPWQKLATIPSNAKAISNEEILNIFAELAE